MNTGSSATGRNGFLPHELAFTLFLGLTAARLFFVAGTANASTLIFTGLTLVPIALWYGSQRFPGTLGKRLRLLAYVPLMAASYAALKTAVPLFQSNRAVWLQGLDQLLFGGNASLWLEPFIHPVLTEILSFLYLGFFGYLAIALWHYGRGEYSVLRSFIVALFTVYGLGFLGYTLIPAAGPYLEMVDQFRVPLAGGWFTHLNDQTVHWGSNRTDCFPCLHFAVSCFILVFDARHCKWRFRWLLLPVVGIWLSTIYLRQHYLVDLLAGVGLMTLGLWLARRAASAPTAH